MFELTKGLKYVIINARKYDEEENIIADYDVPVIFPASIAGKHGPTAVIKQLLLDQHHVKTVSGGHINFNWKGVLNTFGALTEKEDGIDLKSKDEDISIIAKAFNGETDVR